MLREKVEEGKSGEKVGGRKLRMEVEKICWGRKLKKESRGRKSEGEI
jgi:hypothetical protein